MNINHTPEPKNVRQLEGKLEIERKNLSNFYVQVEFQQFIFHLVVYNLVDSWDLKEALKNRFWGTHDNNHSNKNPTTNWNINLKGSIVGFQEKNSIPAAVWTIRSLTPSTWTHFTTLSPHTQTHLLPGSLSAEIPRFFCD